VRRRGINRAGLAAVLPVLDERTAALREAVERLPKGTESPFARIGSTHFARLVLIERFRGKEDEELAKVPACLFFSAEFDISEEGWLEAVCTLLPDDADRVFVSCAGYPGAAVPPLFAKWMLRHRVRAGFSLHANPQATVGEAIRALALRERVMAFALATGSLDPAELHKAWKASEWGRAA
jgi:hypothetical protein